MALVAATRLYRFRAVHSLNTGTHREQLHGHEYALEISTSRSDWKGLDEMLNSWVHSQLEGRDLSILVEHATGEVLVEWIHERLAASPIGPDLLGVALQETRKNRFVSARSNGHLL